MLPCDQNGLMPNSSQLTARQMTADRHGHLFPRGDGNAELAEAERVLLG
jgi:hypothetical protein